VTPGARVRLLPEAIDDIDAIASFIEQDNPDAALNFIGDVFAVIDRLVSFPHLGHPQPADRRRPFPFVR